MSGAGGRPCQQPHHGFGDAEHWASVFESPARAKGQEPDKVVRALELKHGETVIDIGAGTGYFIPAVSPKQSDPRAPQSDSMWNRGWSTT
ncbi:MAG: hypothetical protein ACYDC3_04235 [Candidatus Binataceae bacterium]